MTYIGKASETSERFVIGPSNINCFDTPRRPEHRKDIGKLLIKTTTFVTRFMTFRVDLFIYMWSIDWMFLLACCLGVCVHVLPPVGFFLWYRLIFTLDLDIPPNGDFGCSWGSISVCVWRMWVSLPRLRGVEKPMETKMVLIRSGNILLFLVAVVPLLSLMNTCNVTGGFEETWSKASTFLCSTSRANGTILRWMEWMCN